MSFRTLIVIAAVVAGMSLPAMAQNPPPPPNRPVVQPADRDAGQRPDRTTTPSERSAAPVQSFRAKSILGSKVSIAGNMAVGTVDDIVFSEDGGVEYLLVLNEGKYVFVPWEAAKFNFEQRSATVSITQEQYRRVPTYTAQQWPTVRYFEPDFRTQIYRYYGVTPRQERRIDRIERRRPPAE